eukprot:gb/GECH01001450.1/.p1 GENE.gb/GECH01001450.1/~~gb/GECH01001450.1/.p1  ORF type:complete len:148 (+),score=33.51 gb/GECH01001450.1/:1-444(+)
MSLISRDWDELFDPGFGFSRGMMPSVRPSSMLSGDISTWRPRVDVRETEDNVLIDADLPGLKKQDVNVEYDPSNRTLTLSGETQREKEKESDKFYRMERSYGSFSRTFTMPENIKSDQINGKMDNGVLHVCVPKAKKATKANKIDIQ